MRRLHADRLGVQAFVSGLSIRGSLFPCIVKWESTTISQNGNLWSLAACDLDMYSSESVRPSGSENLQQSIHLRPQVPVLQYRVSTYLPRAINTPHVRLENRIARAPGRHVWMLQLRDLNPVLVFWPGRPERCRFSLWTLLCGCHHSMRTFRSGACKLMITHANFIPLGSALVSMDVAFLRILLSLWMQALHMLLS